VQTRTFSKGDVIFREGDESSEAYRLISGEVEISIGTRGGARTLARLSAGEFFGEMSLIDDKPRSATATALTDCEVELIHEDNFSARVIGDPANLQHYLRTLFDRLRATDALLQWHLNKATQAGQEKSSVEAALRGASPTQTVPSPPAADSARLRLTSAPPGAGDIDVAVTKIPFRIGRATQGGHGLAPLAPNDLSLPDQKPYQVSRNHCIIERGEAGYQVRDLGSRVGTVVNGTPLGIEFDAFTAPLRQGSNTLVLGDASGPHHFRVEVL